MPTSLADLPNEVIFQILLFAPPSSAPTIQKVSRRFRDLVTPLLWRHHCQTQFKYWGEEHGIRNLFSCNAVNVDWKKIFADRHRVDGITSRTVDSIVAGQLDRSEKSERIVGLGYDAKDALLRNLRVGEDAADVLAQRYYSGAVLGHLHRTLGIREWVKLKDGLSVPLERALAVFDMFVLHDRVGDFDEVSACLDKFTLLILAEIPEIMDQSTRQKALTLVKYLRDHKLTGVTSEERYHDLQNSFIGIALQDDNHPSLPLISVAIYCCIARRLGIDAHPCGFPFHVMAIVKPPIHVDLDNRSIDKASQAEPMYTDPFRSYDEVPVATLRMQLSEMGVVSSNHASLLNASSTTEIVRRTARNIIASLQTIPEGPSTVDAAIPEMDSAFYGALWALLMLPDGNGVAVNDQRARCLPHIVELLEKQFFMDVGLIEKHILPLFRHQRHYEPLRETIRLMRVGDRIPKPVKRRTGETGKDVRYRVGQLFQHKRYNYHAIIVGWDWNCKATEEWISRMNVADLARGRHQAFYHVLVEDSSPRYVAEENIEIKEFDVGHRLMNMAGRYFKRFDRLSSTFESNIRDEYLDD